MIKKILIIEDNPNDIKYYKSLFSLEKEINLLFFSKDKDYNKDKLIEFIDLFHGTIVSQIKNCFVLNENEIIAFLKNNPFDFYIADSLGGIADKFIDKAGLSKDTVAFLTSTTSFRDSVWDKGYRAYKKENIDELVSDCFNRN